MLIIPAIDIQDGVVVRLVQGKLNKKVYSKDPVKTAKHWVAQGAKLIHLVDLDGAIKGSSRNLKIVRDIAGAIEVPVEFGGGVRDASQIRALLDSGIWRVVLGTRAAEDRPFLEKSFKEFGNRVIVSVDTKMGTVMVRGWQAGSSKKIDMASFITTLKKIGFEEIIYTDTLKDGTLKGPNIKEIKAILKDIGIKVVASGGVSSLADIGKLKALEKSGLTGVIVGKALYEAKFTLPQALKI